MMFPERPLPSSQLIALSLRTLAMTFARIYIWLLIAVVIASITYFYNAYINQIDHATALRHLHPSWVFMKKSHLFMQLGYPVIMLLVLIWLSLVMLYQVHSSLHNKSTSNNVILANKRYFPFLFSMLITSVFLTLLSPLILPFAFVFPIIIFAPISVAINHYGVFSAFKYAWQLVWGNWWHTFFVIFLTLIMPLLIIAMITVLCFHLIADSAYIIACAQTLGLIIILPLALNVLTILYNDLQLRYNAQP